MGPKCVIGLVSLHPRFPLEVNLRRKARTLSIWPDKAKKKPQGSSSLQLSVFILPMLLNKCLMARPIMRPNATGLIVDTGFLLSVNRSLDFEHQIFALFVTSIDRHIVPSG